MRTQDECAKLVTLVGYGGNLPPDLTEWEAYTCLCQARTKVADQRERLASAIKRLDDAVVAMSNCCETFETFRAAARAFMDVDPFPDADAAHLKEAETTARRRAAAVPGRLEP